MISRVCPLSSSLAPPFKVNKPELLQALGQEFEASRAVVEHGNKTQNNPGGMNANKIVPSASGSKLFAECSIICSINMYLLFSVYVIYCLFLHSYSECAYRISHKLDCSLKEVIIVLSPSYRKSFRKRYCNVL